MEVTLEWGPGYVAVTCKRCGKYRMTKACDGHVPPDLKPLLSAAARQADSPILLAVENLNDLAAPPRSVTVSQKVEKVLRFVAMRCEHPGTPAGVSVDEDFPVADCSDGSEFDEYLKYLRGRAANQARSGV